MPFDLICAFPRTSQDSIWRQYRTEYLNPNDWKYPRSEIWRPISLSPGYEVSSWGRVRNARKQRLRRPQRNRPGGKQQYAMVRLRGKNLYIHRLVLIAFVGAAPEGTEACHWNDLGIDNRIGNLRWDTPRNNKKDVEFTGENRKQVYVPAISKSAGQWICDADCRPASPLFSNFLLDRWRTNDRKHQPQSDRSWTLFEEYMELMALEVAQNDRAA